ncbi:MAG: NAD(P)H-hydrate dehydratase [Acidimicrobiales bacterium]
MLPILTPEEMGAVDRAAPEPFDVLVARAGAAVARAALDLLGGAYGKRVVVVAGKGNNGADGREAARLLERRGVRCSVLDPALIGPGERLADVDLVIDAAFGTGFHGEYRAPDPGNAPVLAVDIPSGVSGLTGEASDDAVLADATVTFGALKPGLVLQPGRARAGAFRLADIGLDCSRATAHLVGPGDVRGWLSPRPVEAHKWKAAVWIVGGSPGMTGAPALACRGAQRAGAGYVRLSIPGEQGAAPGAPIEAVTHELSRDAWASAVLGGLDRFRAVVLGPGLGTAAAAHAAVREVAEASTVALVIDGDGLTALGQGWRASGNAPVVLTPHDGEAERLSGTAPGPDRFAAARTLAAGTGSIVLLKGPTTVVADPDGTALAVTTGDARLATAGTGDVLAGAVGALLAQGVEPLMAAAAAAWLHGRAGTLGPARGLVAGDLPDLLPAAYQSLEQPDDGQQLARP